jgi:phospholipase/carboxylesterase
MLAGYILAARFRPRYSKPFDPEIANENPMREVTLGDLKVRLTGGTDREGSGDGPMVVLLHGFGASGSDLVPLWRQLRVPPGTRFAFPEAPLELESMAPGYDSRAWWMIDMERLDRAMRTGQIRDLSEEEPAGMAEANAKISAMLDELQARYSVNGDKLVLGGFSQGAMLSCDVAFQSARALAGLVLLSGTLLCETRWRELMPKRKGLPVLMSHGRSDPLLPFALAERLRDLLTSSGLPVEFIPFNGGHGIADSVTGALGDFVSRVCGGAA